MAKNTFLSFSTTAGDNTDVGGIGILGSNSVSNFDNALRTLMAILRGDLDNGTVFVTRSTGYTAVAGDNNAFYEFTATATLALTAAAALGTDWHMMVFANGGIVTVDPDASEQINGANTLTIANGDAAFIICTGAAFKAVTIPSAANVATALALKLDTVDAKWLSKAIGELYAVDDSMTGADVPPTDDSRFRYIKLTAGLTGSGQYNNGALTSESVSGSAPLVIATAVISLSGSPLDGRTVNLLNTERRFLRAGSAGTVEQDAIQEHDHANSLISPGGSAAGASGASYTLRSAGAVSGARTANETRAKNIGVTYFMRIK